jgi:hypothetical protein
MLVAYVAFAQQRQPITNMTSEELLKLQNASLEILLRGR